MNRDAASATALMDQASADSLLLTWLAFAGVLLFAAALLWQYGVWSMLLDADPTGITMIILAVFVAATLRCGWCATNRPAWTHGGVACAVCAAFAANRASMSTPISMT